LKYGINEETTMRDMKNLFGEPELNGRDEEVKNLRQKGNDVYNYTGSYCYYKDNDDSPYRYSLRIGFKNGKLNYISLDAKIDELKL
jgi:hypothetical protein